MQRIGELVDDIYGELSGAEDYAKRAVKAKADGDSPTARAYAEMANQELGHAEKLHAMAVSEIGEAERSGAEVPDGMRKVWDWEHGRMVAKTAEVRTMLSMLGG